MSTTAETATVIQPLRAGCLEEQIGDLRRSMAGTREEPELVSHEMRAAFKITPVTKGHTRMPATRMIVTHFIVSDDVERSRRFYTEVLGGTVAFSQEPTYMALANTFIIINVGGGPTDDKPEVTLETPRDPDRVSSFLNIRVADIYAVYTEWSARGAQFLTPPKQHEFEIRCYIRDPDGHI